MDIGVIFAVGLFAGTFTRGGSLLHELSVLLCIAIVIARDEFLCSYVGVVAYACFGFFFTCHLLVFSTVAVLKPKLLAKGKTILQLRDTDLKLEDEFEFSFPRGRTCIQQIFKNSYEFCMFRPVYAILAVVGLISLGFSFLLRVFPFEDENHRKDLHSASLQLILPGVILLAVPLIIANSGVYLKDNGKDVYTYRPFQEKVVVPLKVVAGKALAAFVSGVVTNASYAYAFIVCMMFISGCIIYVYWMVEEEIERMQAKYGMRVVFTKNVRPNVLFLLLSCLALGSLFLGHVVVICWRRAERNVFGIMERNWRRNLRAIEYLLPDVIVPTLEDMQAALDNKRKQQLTDAEKRAFNYVDWPLWQTKRPFAVEKTVAVSANPSVLGSSQEMEQRERMENQREDVEAASQLEHQPPAVEGRFGELLRRNVRPLEASQHLLPTERESDAAHGESDQGAASHGLGFRTPTPIDEQDESVPTPLRRSARLKNFSTVGLTM